MLQVIGELFPSISFMLVIGFTLLAFPLTFQLERDEQLTTKQKLAELPLVMLFLALLGFLISSVLSLVIAAGMVIFSGTDSDKPIYSVRETIKPSSVFVQMTKQDDYSLVISLDSDPNDEIEPATVNVPFENTEFVVNGKQIDEYETSKDKWAYLTKHAETIVVEKATHYNITALKSRLRYGSPRYCISFDMGDNVDKQAEKLADKLQ